MPVRPIIPTYLIHWNAPEWCGSAARSLLASEGVEVRLVVVDNGQDGGPPLETCLPPGTTVLPMASNQGYTAGANAALRHWKDHHPDAPFAVIGSHDLHVDSGTLRRLLDAGAARPDAGILSPGIDAPKPTSGGIAAGDRWVQIPLDGTPEVVERDWANGTCLFLRRACVDEVGWFDERLGSYGEDVDYCLRARDRHWQVLVLTNARARGLGSASPRAADQKVVNSVLLVAKRRGARAAAASMGKLAARATVDAATSLAPWSSTDRRTGASERARRGFRALRRLATDPRLVTMAAGHGHGHGAPR